MTKETKLGAEAAVNGDEQFGQLARDNEAAVLAVRNLVFDLCTQNGGGHGGSALGMAAIGVALWKYVMRYNPADPEWFDRDRFVLSNGHASMFLYVMNYLVGYDAWTIDELKGYAGPKENGYHTLCHGHPERQTPAVEVTTGPLGQGVANAVGLAIASKNLAANFNKPGCELVQSTIWCTTGDGCLMEGVALEAISLAGHLQLDNLVLIYDNNAVTCDGPLDWINNEDIDAKMRSQGWEVLSVQDGNYDVETLVAALKLAKTYKGKPVLINVRTVIGLGTSTAGTHKAHHGAFDKESIVRSKQLAGLDPESTHVVPPDALAFFRERRQHGMRLQQEWERRLAQYSKLYPKEALALKTRLEQNVDNGLSILSSLDSKDFEGKATRETNGRILERLWTAVPSLCGGGADLVNSNMVSYSVDDVFLPQTGYKGRYLRNGIREHAMASIANGMAAYNPGTFLPITATFFMFYLYVQRGAYVIQDSPDYQLTLVSCGSNLHYAVAAAKSLRAQGIATRIVSAPSLDLFETQDDDYKNTVFKQNGRPIVSVEEYVATTWARCVTASIGMTTYGYSASNRSNYDRFGLDAKGIEKKVKQYLALLNGRSARECGWRQL
ncbi:hypothetical protein SLS64_011610 [Diaporthe eres]|uniref:Transketolase n=1 Tax=Diaporthe eres TaxID=83184 RepID=A0ABR1P5X4_DIAER